MTMETFVQIINISLVVLFVSLIAGLLIAIFRGIKKGIWKATFKLFFILACFLAAIFSLNVLANYVGMFDISPFHIPDLKFTGKAEYIVVFDSTLKEGAYEIVKGLLISQGLPYTPQAAELAYALAESIVKFVTFFVEVIVIVIVGNLISSLLWHILFKHFIPKIVRKRVKFKAISSIETALKYVVTSFMMLAPLTALVNTINVAYQRNKRGNTDGVMAYIDSFLNAYDDSLFAKVFFSWTVNDQGLTFDASFMNAITMSTYQEGSIGFVESLYDLTAIGALTGQAVVINTDGSTPTITWTIALEGEFVGSLIDLLINSKLITYILPIAAELGLALVDDPNIEEKIDLDAINWKEELTALKELYQSLYNAGFADYVLTEDGQLQTNFVVEDLLESIISNDKQYSTMLNAIASLDDHEIIKQAIPYAVYYLVEKNRDDEGNTTLPYLPDTWEEIKSVTWCDDLCLVLKTAKRMYDVNPDVLHQVFDLTKSDSSAAMLSAKFADGGDDKYEALIGSIAQNLDQYVTILAGQRSATDPYELANLDEYGKTVLPGGKETDTIYETIFDASLMEYAVRYIPTLLEGKEGIPEEVAQTLTDLNDEYWRLNYKEELNAMLYCLEVVSGRPDDAKEIYSTIKQMTGSGSEDILSLITDSMVHILSSMLPRTDHSRILNSFAYPYAKKYVEEFDFNENLGLSNEIIKFAVDRACDERRLGSSLIPVVDAFPSIKVIMGDLDIKLANSSSSIASHRIKYASEAKEQIQLLAEHYLDVNNVLNAFYECDLINPVLSLDEINDTGFMQDENYVNLISFVYNKVTDLGVDTVKSLVLDANVANWVNENMMISLAIKAVGESDIMSLLDQEMTNALMLQLSDKVETVFTAIGDSASFSKIMGPFLDKTLDSLSGSLLTDGVCFSNVVDWKLEASKMATLMRTIGNSSFDINNLDFSNISNVVDLNNLLHALEDSTIFRRVELDGSVTEFFSIWAYNKINSFLDEFKDGAGNSYALGTDPTDDPTLSDYPHHYLKNDFLSVDGSEWYGEGFIVKDKSLFDDPDFYEKYVDILNADELGRMAKVVYWGNKIANDSGSSSIMELDAEFIVNTLQSLNDSKVLRIGVYNFYKIAQDKFENDFLNLKAANLSYLLDCGQGVGAENTLELRALRKQEVDVFTDLYAELKKVNDMGVIDMNNNTFNFDLVDDELADEVQSIVNRIVTSRVFHTDGPQPGSGEFTVFQGVLVKSMEALDKYDIIYNSSSPKDIYYHDLYESYKESTETIGKGKIKYLIDKYFNYTKAVTNPSEQIEYLNEVFEIARAAFGLKKGDGSGTNYIGIKDKDGKISTNIDNYNMADPAFLTAVRQVLENVQESEVLNDISLNGIAKVLSKADSMVEGLNVKFSSANVYYAYGVQDVTGVDFSGCNWDAGIQDEDIEILLYLVEQVGLYQNKDENCDIPVIDDIGSNMDKLNSAGIKNILNMLFNSSMFHQAGPAVKLTPQGNGFDMTYINTENIDGADYHFTVAQSLIKEILSINDIKDLYYMSSSPKDQYTTNYITANGKIAYNVSTIFPYDGGASEAAIEDEIIRITDFIEVVKNLGSLDFNTFDYSDDEFINTVEDALLTARESKLLKDLPLNIINKILEQADSMIDGFDNVKFSNANVYHVYGVQDKTDFSKCSWDASITDDDIEIITYLIKQAGLYQNGETCDIPKMDNISTDLSSINSEGIKNLLKKLFSSEMFHSSGPAMKLVETGGSFVKEYVNTEVFDNVEYHFTIAQSIMREVLSINDVKNYYYVVDSSPKDQYNFYTGVYTSAESKIAYNISHVFPYGKNVDANKISAEIDQIGVFVDRISKLGSLDLDTFDYSEDAFIEKVASLLREAGKSELFKDFPLNVVYKALDEASDMLSGFTYLNMKDANVYYIYGVQNKADFSQCRWDETIQEEDIDVICYLLKQAGLYDKGSGDSDIPVMSEINNDLSKLNPVGIKTLFNSLFTSKIFHLEGPAMKLTSATTKAYIGEAAYEYNYTVAQNVMREVLSMDNVKEYYYLTDSPKDQYFAYGSADKKIASNVKTIFPYGVSASNKDIEDEIINITNFFGKVKNLGSLDIDSFDYSQDDFIQKVRELLIESGKSKTFKDFSLNLIYKLLGEADEKLNGFGSVKLSSANVFYAYDIQNKDDFSKCNWNATIQNEDVEVICYLIKQVGLYDKGSANCDIPNIDALGGDISKVDTAGIRNLFNTLFLSDMFHLEGPAMKITGTNIKDYVNTDVIDGAGYNFTVAQSIMSELLKLDDVKEIYFLNDSPKDQYTTNYITANGKIAYNIKTIFPYGVSASNKAIEDEIEAITKFIDSVKSLGSLDYDTFDFTSTSFISTVRNVLEKARDSLLLKDLPLNLIKKMLTEADDKLSGLTYVKLSSANVYYAYGIQDQTDFSKCNWDASIQDEDIETICYLIEQVGLYEKHNPDCDIPVMNDINDDLSKINTNGIKNLLNNLFMSKMFHKAGPAMKIVGNDKQYINSETVDAVTRSFTVAQDLVREILAIDGVKDVYFLSDSPKDQYTNNYMTVDGKIAYNVTTIFPYGLSASNKAIEDEIVAISNFINAIKGIGSLDTDDYDFADEGFVTSVRNILEQSRESLVLRDFPLNLIKKMLGEANGKLTDLTYVDLSNANVYYSYDIQNQTDFSKCNWNATITDNDIDTICYLIRQVGLYENHNADCDIPIMSDFTDNLDNVNTTGIKNVLTHLFNSDMFHLSGQAMKLVSNGSGFDKEYVNPEIIDGTEYEFTVAQGMIREILGLQKIKEVYYLNSGEYVSPKDHNATNYATVAGKSAYNVSVIFPYGPSASTLLMDKEITAIGDFIDSIKEMGTVDVGGIDFASADPAASAKVFHAANKSDLLMDLVPNVLCKIFVGMGTGTDLGSLVNFADADTFYHYRTNSGSDNYNVKFPSNEIDNVAELMHLYQVLVGEDGLDGGEISDFSSFNRLIRKGHLWNILVALHDSEIMHAKNQYKLTTKEQAEDLKAATTYNPKWHMTVFEQVINMMIETSGISEFIYKYENGIPKDDPIDAETTCRFETLLKIKTISLLEIKGIAESEVFADYPGYNTDWITDVDKDANVHDELHALHDFLGIALKAMNGELDIKKVTLVESKLTPDQVEELLNSLNRVDTIAKAVEVIVYNGFESMDLIKYSKYKGDKIMAKFDLGQEGYGGKLSDLDIPERLVGTEIHLIKQLLQNLSYENPLDNGNRNAYYNFTDIPDLAEHIESLDGAMTYIKNSAIFAKTFNPDDPTIGQLNGRSLLMANIFKSITIDEGSKHNLLEYFVGAGDDQRILNIYKIFQFDAHDFSTLAEAKAVHYLLRNAGEIAEVSGKAATYSDAAEIMTVITTIHRLMSDCVFEEGRSFFVSQIVGEMLNDFIVNEENEILSGPYASYYIPVRFGPATAAETTAMVYDETIFSETRISIPVSDKEADGLQAAIEALIPMKDAVLDYGAKKMAAMMGPVPFEDLNQNNFTLLHNKFNIMGTSCFARVIYLSRMHQGVTTLAAEYTSWNSVISQYIYSVGDKLLFKKSFTGFGDYATALGW